MKLKTPFIINAKHTEGLQILTFSGISIVYSHVHVTKEQIIFFNDNNRVAATFSKEHYGWLLVSGKFEYTVLKFDNDNFADMEYN